MTAVVYAAGVAVTEPVPVTLPTTRGEEERGASKESEGERGSGGFISTVWGEGAAGVAREGTAVMLSVLTSREETWVTVPD